MKILVIDNYDSFTYNLVHALKKFEGVTVEVKRNDEVAEGEPDLYDKIVFSPGPGLPEEAGSMLAIIKNYAGKKTNAGRMPGTSGNRRILWWKVTKYEQCSTWHCDPDNGRCQIVPVRWTSRDF